VRITRRELRRLIAEAVREDAQNALDNWPKRLGQYRNHPAHEMALGLMNKGKYDTVLRLYSQTLEQSQEPLISSETLKDAVGWGLLGASFVADLFPGLGTVASTGIGVGYIGLELSRNNFLGAALGIMSIISPVVGDGIAIVGKALQAGNSIPKPILRKLNAGLSRVSDRELQSWVTQNMQEVLPPGGASNIVNKMLSEFNKFKSDISRLV